MHASLIFIVEKNIFWHQGRRATFYRHKCDMLTLVLGKVKKFEGPTFNGSLSNRKNAKGGGLDRVNLV